MGGSEVTCAAVCALVLRQVCGSAARAARAHGPVCRTGSRAAALRAGRPATGSVLGWGQPRAGVSSEAPKLDDFRPNSFLCGVCVRACMNMYVSMCVCTHIVLGCAHIFWNSALTAAVHAGGWVGQGLKGVGWATGLRASVLPAGLPPLTGSARAC